MEKNHDENIAIVLTHLCLSLYRIRLAQYRIRPLFLNVLVSGRLLLNKVMKSSGLRGTLIYFFSFQYRDPFQKRGVSFCFQNSDFLTYLLMYTCMYSLEIKLFFFRK